MNAADRCCEAARGYCMTATACWQWPLRLRSAARGRLLTYRLKAGEPCPEVVGVLGQAPQPFCGVREGHVRLAGRQVQGELDLELLEHASKLVAPVVRLADFGQR